MRIHFISLTLLQLAILTFFFLLFLDPTTFKSIVCSQWKYDVHSPINFFFLFVFLRWIVAWRTNLCKWHNIMRLIKHVRVFAVVVCGGDVKATVTNGDTCVTDKCHPVSCARSHRTFHVTPVCVSCVVPLLLARIQNRKKTFSICHGCLAY